MWTERLSIICGPANALERVARFVVRHAHDLREAQGASGGAEQEMLRHGVQSLVGDGPASLPWKSRRQLDYIPGDDRDDGVQSRCGDLGVGRRANGDRFRL